MLKSGPLAPYNHVQRLIKGRQYLQMARGLMVGLSNETLSIRVFVLFSGFFFKNFRIHARVRVCFPRARGDDAS